MWLSPSLVQGNGLQPRHHWFESSRDSQLVNTIIILSFHWYDTTCHRSVVSKGERQVYTMNSVRTGVLLNKQYTKNKRIVM